MKHLLNLIAAPNDNVLAFAGEPLRPDLGRKVHLENYGCQMNLSDSEIIGAVLRQAGYAFTPTLEEADVILLNTCAVREHAEERVLGRLRELTRYKTRKPELILGVLGCMAQHLGESIVERAPFVDVVMGPDSYRHLPRALSQATDAPFLDLCLDKREVYDGIEPLRKDGVAAWLTIQRGCDKFCTFCIVPFVRGRERSVPLETLVEQTSHLAAQGVKEVTLLGQTVNSYRDDEHDFADLLEAVADVEGIERVRFTSPHPSDATDAMIRVMAENQKVCKHIHLPMQSASNNVLRLMRRTYMFEQYRNVVENLRTRVRDVAITTDLIVGFPGETESDFRATRDAIERFRFDGAFMFKYSPREGTVAYRKYADDVPDEEKGRRLDEIVRLQEGVSLERYRSRIGATVEVLIEGVSKRDRDQYYGKTDDFKTCVFPRQDADIGDIATVRVEDATAHTLIGHIENGGPPR